MKLTTVNNITLTELDARLRAEGAVPLVTSWDVSYSNDIAYENVTMSIEVAILHDIDTEDAAHRAYQLAMGILNE